MPTQHCGRHLVNNNAEQDNNINEKIGCINPY